jgi:DNA-binding transcriptional MerR regulator
MLKIGDFSRLSRVSVRMLRYYDDAGLVKPEKLMSLRGIAITANHSFLQCQQIRR